MGVIWTSQTRNRQPAGIVPIAPQFQNGLVYLGGRHTDWRNQSGFFSTVPSALANGTVWEGGEATRFNASAKITSPTFPGVTGGNPQTLFAYFRASPSPYGFAVVVSVDATDGSTIARLQYNSGATEFAYYANGSPVNIGALTAGMWYAIAVVDDGSTVTVIINGKTSTIARSVGGFVATNLYVGGYGGSGAEYNSDVALAGFWKKNLPVSSFIEVTQNPWQLFAPERRPIFFNVASGGGSTVSGVGSSTGTATASGVITSTSAQVGSASGTGTASGTGASTSNSVGSSSGTGAASGVGSSTGGSDGAGSSSGTGTATGVGASTAASTGSTSGTGTATGVGENGSVTVSSVGSASGTGTALGIAPSHGGGNGTGRNLSRKQKKKLKAVESQEWLKAEETARQLLNDRFTKQTPQEKAEALQTYVESLQPVIEALKALTSPEVKESEEPIIELTPHQEILTRFDNLEKKLKSVEDLVIILMADL